jgi:hypothetical protein
VPKYLEAMAAEDLGIVIAGEHFAATQTMDEQTSKTVNYDGAFGSKGAVVRTITPADADTISFSTLLLKPGQHAGMADESFMRGLSNFKVAAQRGSGKFYVYQNCEWTSIRIASTLQSVNLSADFSGNIAA